jgi:hypothetical protein
MAPLVGCYLALYEALRQVSETPLGKKVSEKLTDKIFDLLLTPLGEQTKARVLGWLGRDPDGAPMVETHAGPVGFCARGRWRQGPERRRSLERRRQRHRLPEQPDDGLHQYGSDHRRQTGARAG